jgi:hypothetical protein
MVPGCEQISLLPEESDAKYVIVRSLERDSPIMLDR